MTYPAGSTTKTAYVQLSKFVYNPSANHTKYTANAGIKELRMEIAKYLKRKYAMDYTYENVVVTVGGSEAIDLAIRALVEPGDEVILVEPCFVSFFYPE